MSKLHKRRKNVRRGRRKWEEKEKDIGPFAMRPFVWAFLSPINELL